MIRPHWKAIGATLLIIALILFSVEHARARAASRGRTAASMKPHEFGPGTSTPMVAPEAGDTVAVAGVVTDEVSRPIPRAEVAVFGSSERQGASREALVARGRLCTTGPDGTFSFPGSALPVDGDGVLVARHPHYVGRSVPVRDDHSPILIVLKQGATIEGRVVGAVGGAPVENVVVAARGTGANVESGSPTTFAPVRCVVQHAVTGGSGAFEVRGLPDGWYQLEVVEPGLTVVPGGLELNDSGAFRFGQSPKVGFDRALVVRTGSRNVDVRVVALAVAVLRVVDAGNGAVVPWPAVAFHAHPAFEPWPNVLCPDNTKVVVDGRTFWFQDHCDGSRVSSRLFISTRWPVPIRETIKVVINARGYEQKELDVALQPPGGVGNVTAQNVPMDPSGARGSARFRLVQQDGSPVHHAESMLQLVDSGGSEVEVVPLWFGENGVSDTVSLPEGGFRVRYPAGPGEHPHFREASLAVTRSGVATLDLILEAGAVEYDVADQHGNPVDDVGIAVRLASTGNSLDQLMTTDSGLLLGLPYALRPGLGATEPRVFLGGGTESIEAIASRHGYLPARAAFQLQPGFVQTVRLVLIGGDTADWPPR
jgi:hypothetical protein